MGIKQSSIILQLPLITPSQRWIITHVAENYKRNGFRIGANANSIEEAEDLLRRIRPAAIKIDASHALIKGSRSSLAQLGERACEFGTKLIFNKIEKQAFHDQLQDALPKPNSFSVQGYLFDYPSAIKAKPAEKDDVFVSAKSIALRPSNLRNAFYLHP